jgi:mRNA interferase RelE/StbE
VAERLKSLEQGLSGDVKRLTNVTPEYRPRVGSDRVLFEIEAGGHVEVTIEAM